MHQHSEHALPNGQCSLPDGQPRSVFRLCIFILHSRVRYLPAERQASPGHLPASSKGRGQQSPSLTHLSKLSPKSFMRRQRQRLSSLRRIWTATNAISHERLCSDLAEMFFCNIKILQKPCRGLYVCQRCFFQMLKAPTREGVGGLFFSALHPRGGVGGCAVIQSGGVSKELISIPRTLLRKSDPTSQCTSCFVLYNIQKEAVLVKSHGKWMDGEKVEIHAMDAVIHGGGSIVVHLTRRAVVYSSLNQYEKHTAVD